MADETISIRAAFRDGATPGLRKVREEAKKTTTEIDKGNKQAARSSETLLHRVNSLGSGLGRVTTIGSRFSHILGTITRAAAGFLGVQGLIGVGLVTTSINLVETSQKFEQVFGPAVGRASAYVKDIHDRYGIFTGSLKDSLSTFGDIGRSIGLTGDQLANFSSGLVGAALDISSLKNISIEDVFGGFQSLLAGEQEAGRRFGIFINEKQVADYAHQVMHLTGELTEQQKVQARAALILDQFNRSAAKGDLARTANSPANQLRQLGGRFRELAGIVGGIALAPLGAFLPNTNRELKRLERRLTDWTKGVQERTKTLGPDVVDAFKRGDLGGVAEGIDKILGAGGKLKGPLEDLLVTFRDFGRIIRDDLIPVAKDIAAVLVPALDLLRRFFDGLAPGTVRNLLEAFLAWKAVTTVVGGINAVKDALYGLAKAETTEAAAQKGGILTRLGAVAGLGAAASTVVAAGGANAGLGALEGARGGFKQKVGGVLAVMGVNPLPLLRHVPFIGSHVPNPFGDTGSPRASTLNAHSVVDGMTAGNRTITSGYRTWGLGSPGSDHATGRAVDVAGANLGSYVTNARALGMFGELHGTGPSRHAHMAVGDTATPARFSGGGRGADSPVVIHVWPSAGMDERALAAFTRREFVRYERDKEERAGTAARR